MYQEIAKRLKHRRGFSKRNLHLFVALYKTYPQIVQTLSGQSGQQNWILPIVQTVSAQLTQSENTMGLRPTDPHLLVSRLSFSHFIELIQADTFIQRTFYEVEAIKNNWEVRELRRAIETSLYERTGLSTDKAAVIEKIKLGKMLSPEEVMRNPYILEFLNIDEKAEYTESDLETAVYTKTSKTL